MSAAGAATILVVDDDTDLREALCALLEDHGYATREARNGREALAALRGPDGGGIGLVLLDLMMPELNGWDFRVEQVRDPALATVPVVVMTAAGNLAARPIVADAILRKPASMEDVLDAVRASLRR